MLETFQPKLSAASRQADVLFLANIQPCLQRDVLEQCEQPRLVALDSMNLWIDIARADLVDVISRVDCLILNDAELRQLTGKPSLVGAAREALSWGPSTIVAKQGEYGAALLTADGFFAPPAYPLEVVVDPTGAGDAFAGGATRRRRAARWPTGRRLRPSTSRSTEPTASLHSSPASCTSVSQPSSR